MKRIHNALLATSLLGAAAVHAEDQGVFSKGLTGETAYDKLWSAATLYKDSDNPYIQEFSLQGRLQLQTIYGEAGGDSFNTSDYKDASADNDERVWGNDVEVRRARFGFKSKLFQTFKFEGQIDVDPDGDDNLYKDIYDLFLTYAPTDAFNLSLGKTKVKFSREQEISSKEILTIERGLLANTLFPGELTGIWASGKGIADHWLYEFGVYGNDRQREFTDFEGGAIILAKIGYDYSAQAGVDSAIASIHIMHNTDPSYRSTDIDDNYTPSASPAFENSFAITNDIVNGRLGLTTELLYATGDGAQSDVFGLTIIPSYFIADGLQLVGRLQVATSSGPDGLRVPARYERLAAGDDERGNTYVSGYLGLNYYFYGHKLKVMTGIEYSEMGGGTYDGYTAMTGLRMFF